MDDSARQFLHRLLKTPSPSGYEQQIQREVKTYIEPFADSVRIDSHGNLFATHNAANDDAPKIMLAGHCDQIGLMVQHIDGDGYLYIQPIGGWDMQILLGQYMTVWTKSGPLQGVVARRAIHLLSPEERKKVPDFHDVWIDVGFKTKEEAQQSVRLGDAVTFTLGHHELRNDLEASPGMDDKVGLWVVMEALRLLHGRTTEATTVSVSTVAEEIGLRGATTAAYSIEPTIGIAVDVCHATDTPGTDKKSQGDIRCGAGPVIFRGANINPRIFDRLEEIALQHSIPHQLCGSPKATGTDANAIQISRAGVAAGLIGIANRYMHSPVEVVHRDDLSNAAKLLAEFCASVKGEDDWTP